MNQSLPYRPIGPGGMLLRDHLAALAMQKFLGPDSEMPSIGDCTRKDLVLLAQDAYKVADAMLEAR